ncbi:Endonoid [Micropterus dolomieu adomavirus 1]|uniref:LO1a n=1 Tax=Micropterus dolomieu adomavirus 1 TaxID=2744370 RepID=A0AAE8YGK4_9VIRU|nr:LO1a [Micropterus dolomieu adomavirus 1]
MFPNFANVRLHNGLIKDCTCRVFVCYKYKPCMYNLNLAITCTRDKGTQVCVLVCVHLLTSILLSKDLCALMVHLLCYSSGYSSENTNGNSLKYCAGKDTNVKRTVSHWYNVRAGYPWKFSNSSVCALCHLVFCAMFDYRCKSTIVSVCIHQLPQYLCAYTSVRYIPVNKC